MELGIKEVFKNKEHNNYKCASLYEVEMRSVSPLVYVQYKNWKRRKRMPSIGSLVVLTKDVGGVSTGTSMVVTEHYSNGFKLKSNKGEVTYCFRATWWEELAIFSEHNKQSKIQSRKG